MTLNNILHISEGLIQTNDKFLELVIFAVLNMCTHLRLTKEEGLGVLHTVMFRDTVEDRLRETDLVKKMAVEQEYVKYVEFYM